MALRQEELELAASTTSVMVHLPEGLAYAGLKEGYGKGLSLQGVIVEALEEMIERKQNRPKSAPEGQQLANLIVATVAEQYGVTVDELKGPRRELHVVVPRHIAMYLIRDRTNLSLPSIGKMFGRRDHTTVLNALKRIKQANLPVRRQIAAIEQRLDEK